MVGLWGRKKEEKRDEPAPAPAPEPAPAAPAADMFGGLAPKTRRKKVQSETPEASETASHHETASHVEEETRSAPFFSKFEMTAADQEGEDEDTARLRRRLERFYEEYNPSKLSQIDQTLASYAGKEDDLFAALVLKYGPEPAELPRPAVAADGAWKTGEFPAATDEGGWGTAGAGSDGFGGGFQTDGGAGFGAEFEPTSGFQFGGGEAAEAAEGGFQFGAAQGEEHHGAEAAEQPSNGAGFGFLAENEEASPAQTNDAQAAHVSDDSDDDEPTLNERHAREMNDANATVDEASQQIALSLRQLSEVIARRKATVSNFCEIEIAIDQCIQKEDFQTAESLNHKLEQVGASITAIDASENQCVAQLPVLLGNWTNALEETASTYLRHREELVANIGDEEQKTERFISETSSRLDHAQEKITASLERANRMLHNAEQEVINVEQRNSKIQEKIHEQTKGLKEKRTLLASEKDKLDAEIRELEAALQQKRRLSADKKFQLSELDEKLNIILSDHAETLAEVERHMIDEGRKKTDAQNTVDDLSHQESVLQREQREFDEQRDDMRRIIQNSKTRITDYLSRVDSIQQETAVGRSYFANVIENALSARTKNRALLLQFPHKETADVSSPMAAVNQLQNQHQKIVKDIEELKASESSHSIRVQEIRKSLPLLEAAKKAAAQAKQFREAQAKTEEIRNLTEECTKCAKLQEDAMQQSETLERQAQQLTAQIAKERKVASAKMIELIRDYKNSLLDSISSAEESPTIISEEVLSSLHDLLRTLNSEVNAAVGDDEPTDSVEEPTVEEAASADPPVAAAPVAVDTNSALSDDEIRQNISELEAEMNEAIEAESFLKCDELQERIDALQAILNSRAE